MHGCLTEWGAYAVYESVCLVGVRCDGPGTSFRDWGGTLKAIPTNFYSAHQLKTLSHAADDTSAESDASAHS